MLSLPGLDRDSLTAVLSSMPDGLLVHAPRGQILEVNDRFCAMVGYDRDELLGLSPPFPFWSDGDRDGRQQEAFVQGREGSFDLTLVQKGGTALPVTITTAPVNGGGPLRGGFIAVVRPVSGRRWSDLQIAAAEAMSRAVLASLPAHIAVLDNQGTVIAVNEAWEDFARNNAGVSGCGVGQNYLSVCKRAEGAASEEAPEAERGIRDVLEKRQSSFVMEYPCHCPEKQRWFLMTVAPLKHDGGGVVVAHLDISARKRGEQRMSEMVVELDQIHRRLEQLVANVPGVVWEAYGEPRVDRLRMGFISHYVETMLGYPIARWRDEPGFWLKVIHPDDQDRAERDLAAIFDGGQGGMCEFRWVAKDGRVLAVESRISVIHDEHRRPIGLRGVTMDITARKRAYRALRRRAAVLIRLARQLKRSNNELDQFAYITSHDLRAPLRGIANLSQWIEEDLGDKTTPEVHKQLELLRGRVTRMEKLIDGILAYSRIGRVKVLTEAVDVRELLREVIDLLAPPPTARVRIAGDMPMLQTPRILLQQVFLNLIGNALKHAGRQDAVVEITCRDTGGPMLEFAVQDNGPGIDPAYHDKVFVIFQTLQPRDKVEGTGVGLSLVKKAVEHMGGRVRLESREGSGSTFYFTWPKILAAAL